MASISGSLSSPPLLTAVPPKPPSGETRESLPVQQGGAKGASVPTRGSLTCRLHDGHSGARYRAGHLLRDPRRASLHGNPGLRRLARRRCSGSVKPKTPRAGSTFTFQFPSPWRLCLEGRRPAGSVSGRLCGSSARCPPGIWASRDLGSFLDRVRVCLALPQARSPTPPSGQRGPPRLITCGAQSTGGKLHSCPRNSTTWLGGAGAWHTRNLAQ